MSKAQIDGAFIPAKPKRPKQFDTRMLDRVESYASQYRHWLNYDNTYASYPAEIRAGCADDIAYVHQQQEAWRVRLMTEAQAVANELACWTHDDTDDIPARLTP